MSHLVDFYRGLAADTEGRNLADLWAFSDDEMEEVHDFIQWVFPLREPSRFNPDAPLVEESDIREFKADSELQEALAHSFRRFLAFLGLTFEAGKVVEAADFATKAIVWRYPNHNWLRITRVLTSTRMLGLEAESRAFFDFLVAVRNRPFSGIDARTFQFWTSAAN
jgi:Opioid growth factor receptor (OGFr) conserved region